jgi:manganese/zinc/iron transport system permease protein
MHALISALLFSAGYNTALVTLGAALLGAGAGAIGAFILLRKRSLVSDAISHSTLPGLAAAFILMVAFGGDGRWLPGLLLGAAASSAIGLFFVEWITRRTRLGEDAAIGAVLSVFFGAGVVLMTVIQTLESGRQAGIATFLLGSTAGMLRSEAETIAVAALLIGVAIFILRRQFTLVCFDQEYAATRGINVRLTDFAMMGLLLAVTVIGLKVAGLVLIVALTIIPPVAARFWTERPERMVLIATGLGALAAYFGAALSSTAAGLPTGALIVLSAFALFLFSLILSPVRGLLANALGRYRFQKRVHERQGLLALARGEPVYDAYTLKLLRGKNLIRPDGVPTEAGRAAATDVARDEALWSIYRRLRPEEAASMEHKGLVPIAKALPPDVIADLDRQFMPREVRR